MLTAILLRIAFFVHGVNTVACWSCRSLDQSNSTTVESILAAKKLLVQLFDLLVVQICAYAVLLCVLNAPLEKSSNQGARLAHETGAKQEEKDELGDAHCKRVLALGWVVDRLSAGRMTTVAKNTYPDRAFASEHSKAEVPLADSRSTMTKIVPCVQVPCLGNWCENHCANNR